MAKASSISASVQYSIDQVLVIAQPVKPSVTMELINDAVNCSKDKADRIVSALSAYPCGRALIESADQRRVALSVLVSTRGRIAVVFDNMMLVLQDTAGIDWGKAAEGFKECTAKLAAEESKANKELMSMALILGVKAKQTGKMSELRSTGLSVWYTGLWILDRASS